MFDCDSRILAKDVTTYADLHAGRVFVAWRRRKKLRSPALLSL
ncbi:hypothetical protein [Mycobacterium shottsii]|nr:hypothetical protein [Mycobacterium shottsii]EPQ74330.1 hypothetical protein MMEU_1990 [Mycobacterium marinum str. Europe]